MLPTLGWIAIAVAAQPDAPPPACEAERVSLRAFVHATNDDFVRKVTTGRYREFTPTLPLGVVGADGGITHLFGEAEAPARKFLRYQTNNGWNNQLLDVLCAAEMASLLNRTLVLPPFAWRKRRGNSSVSLGRILDLLELARLTPLIAEDEAGSVGAALEARGASRVLLRGEGQPHRKKRMPRWDAEGWTSSQSSNPADVIEITPNLFWTWRLSPTWHRAALAHVAYHPTLVRAAIDAAKVLGGDYGAMHVRRGDKVGRCGGHRRARRSTRGVPHPACAAGVRRQIVHGGLGQDDARVLHPPHGRRGDADAARAGLRRDGRAR